MTVALLKLDTRPVPCQAAIGAKESEGVRFCVAVDHIEPIATQPGLDRVRSHRDPEFLEIAPHLHFCEAAPFRDGTHTESLRLVQPPVLCLRQRKPPGPRPPAH